MFERDDGSIATSNINSGYGSPKMEYGIHQGMVTDVFFTDNPENDSGIGSGPSKAVLYEVTLLGGRRDGQVYYNVPIMRTFYGSQNYSETTLKPLINASGIDQGSELNVAPLEEFGNGDIVYLQFLDGNIRSPIIVGLGRNSMNPHIEATLDERQRKVSRFNGIETSIDKDGVYTWTKDTGSFVNSGVRVSDPLKPLIEEFQPDIEKAVSIKVDNDPKLLIEYAPAGTTTSDLSLDFALDKLEYNAAGGCKVSFDGTEDSITMSLAGGISVLLDGKADDVSIATKGGMSVNVSGVSDEFKITTSAGSNLSIGKSNVELAATSGGKLTIDDSSISILDSTGAGFKAANGLVALGGPGGELLQILEDLIQSFSTATYAGFGAPGSNVADIAQALIKLKTIKGSL